MSEVAEVVGSGAALRGLTEDTRKPTRSKSKGHTHKLKTKPEGEGDHQQQQETEQTTAKKRTKARKKIRKSRRHVRNFEKLSASGLQELARRWRVNSRTGESKKEMK